MNDKKLIIVVGASKDHYGAYAENCEGIYAAGDTIEETQKDVLEAIRLLKENLAKADWPEILREEYEIVWKYDVQTLLRHFQGIITNAALERLTGINKKQLWNYANGKASPRPETREKIQTALNKLGEELRAVAL